jgi:hypothetical protein
MKALNSSVGLLSLLGNYLSPGTPDTPPALAAMSVSTYSLPPLPYAYNVKPYLLLC